MLYNWNNIMFCVIHTSIKKKHKLKYIQWLYKNVIWKKKM